MKASSYLKTYLVIVIASTILFSLLDKVGEVFEREIATKETLITPNSQATIAMEDSSQRSTVAVK